MNFKNIQAIFAFISLPLLVSSSPIINSGSEGEVKIKSFEVSNDETFTTDKMMETPSEFTNNASLEFEKTMKKEEDNDNDDDVYTVSADEGNDNDDNDSSDEEITSDVSGDQCVTPECILTSSRILSNMNEEIDPCDDFYQFACGNYMKGIEIPADKMGVTSFNDVNDSNINVLLGILEGDYKVNDNLTLEQQKFDKKIFGQLKSLYNSCIDENTIKSKGKTPLVNLFNQLEIYKHKDSYADINGLTTLIAKLTSYNVPMLIGIDVDGNFYNPKVNVINIRQPDLILQTKSNYNNEKTVAQYKELIKAMFINIFGDSKRDFDKLSNSIVEFEKKLANIHLPPESIYDLTLYKEYNIASLNKEFPYINWALYFESIFDAANMKGTIKNDSSFLVVGPPYFNELNKVLKETDTETLAAYAEWNVIYNYGEYISSEFNAPLKNMQNVLQGTTAEPARTEICVSEVDSFMGMAMGKYFVEKVFSEESREMAEEAVENIKESMKQRIPEVTWLDDQTSASALEKLNAITDKIGYPDFIMDPIKLNEKYQGLKIVDNEFFTNVVNSSKFNVIKKLEDAYTPRDKSKWIITPSTVNAYYNPLANDINFPAGILRSPFFSSTDPSYINYGGIGTVIGHELTHAFDNTGKEFDLDGKYFNWWNNSTEEEFNKLSQCFVEQYGNYTVEDNEGNKININGNLTLGENIADNGGLARAYEAYKISLNKKSKNNNNQSLPGLTKYSNEQLFFISFGQIWCAKARPEIEAMLANIDPHSPARYRVNGSLMNSKEFSKVFNCKPNSPMNPEKKCSLW